MSVPTETADATSPATPSDRSLDELLRLPLTHAAVALWMYGTFRIGWAWFDQGPTGMWCAAALLSAVSGALLAGYHRWPRALIAPLLIGLWAGLGFALLAGTAWPGLTLFAAIYALGVWLVGRSVLQSDRWRGATAVILGGEISAEAIDEVEPRLRWWGLAIALGALALATVSHSRLLLTPHSPLAALLGAGLATALFLLLGALASRQRVHVYLLAAVLAHGLVLWFAGTQEPAASSWLLLVQRPALAHTMLTFGALLIALGWATARMWVDDSLFRPALHTASRWIAFAAMVVTLPHLAAVVTGNGAAAASSLLAASAMLLVVNRESPLLGAAPIAVGAGTLALHGLAIGLLGAGRIAPGVPLELALLEHATVALAIAVTMAACARWFERRARTPLVASLSAVSSLVYAVSVLALLGLAPLGFLDGGWHWTLALGIALLGLFPVLAPLEGAAVLRGVAFPVFATGLFHCVAVTRGVEPGYAWWAGTWGFLLLAIAIGLEQWNRRWPQWAISPSASAGLAPALVLAAGGLHALGLASGASQSWSGLVALVIASGAIGWWRAERRWLSLSMLLLVVLESVLALRLADPQVAQSAHAFAALATSLTLGVATFGLSRFETHVLVHPDSARAASMRWVLAGSCHFLAILAIGYLGWHTGWTILAGRLGEASGGAVAAAGLAGGILIALAVRLAHRRVQSRWIYACAALGLLVALYLRVSLFSAALWTATDTTVLVAAAFALYAVQRITRTTATMHLVLVLPVIALLTVPLELGSAHAGNTLVAVATLYLLIRSATGSRLALYLGAICLNAALYFWIPLWASRLDLFQLYVLPVAASVLGLLHLHRDELPPATLNTCRLAAVSTLYAGAGLDVFVHPGLGPFALALLLAMAGIGLGIALRIRAFLYAGVAFLVLTVCSQLWQLYPEDRLGRAILLLALGTAITGAMIAFNVKRESIMQRVRVFRADLAAWE